MIKFGRRILASSVLNWRSLWDDILFYVRGLNQIDHESLKLDSVLRSHFEIGTVLKIEGLEVTNIENVHFRFVKDSPRTNLSRFNVFIDEPEFRPLMITYRANLIEGAQGNVPGATAALGTYLKSRLSVDGVELDLANSSRWAQYGDTLVKDISPPGENTLIQLSGMAVVFLIPGQHTMGVSIETDGTFRMLNFEMQATDLRL